MSDSNAALGASAFLSAGSALSPGLVLLHGIGGTAYGWAQQIEKLQGYRLVAWNACGYAGSAPLASTSPRSRDYGEVLEALLDALDIEKMALVASSWGATIAIDLAARSPERVTHLVLSGPTAGYGSLPPQEREALIASRADRAARSGIDKMLEADAPRLVATQPSPELSARLARSRQGVTLGGFRQALSALAHADAVAALKTVKCPTLIIYGQEDVIAPPASHALRLAEALPRAEVRAISGCGHLPHLEHPKLFERLLIDFLAA